MVKKKDLSTFLFVTQFCAQFKRLKGTIFISISLTYTHLNPYFGLGLGMARFEHENSPAMQFMLGADYELPTTLPITIGAEYRFFKVNEHGGNRGEVAKLNSNILMLKVRYHF